MGSAGPQHPHLRSVHASELLRRELKELCLQKFEQPVADKVGRRSVIAIGKGWYGYGQTKHQCIDCPRIMEIGDQIARQCLPAGISPKFTHALIVATQKFKE